MTTGKQRRILVAVLGAVFSMLSIFGIAFSQTTTPTQPRGKIVCAVVTLQEQSVDPHKFTGALLTPIFTHLNTGLMRNDLEGKFVPGIVKAWKVTNDGLTWELILRNDVKFWNGEPVTPEDVKFSIERYSKPEMKTPGAGVMSRYLKGVEITGDGRVLVHATAPYPDLPRRISTAYPVSKKYYDKVGEEAFGKNPMSCGPFKLVKNTVGESFEMEAFQDFYDTDRTPRVKNVLLRIIPEASTRMAALRVGEVDIIEGLAGASIAEVKNTPGMKIFSSSRTASLYYYFLDAFLESGSPFADKRVRQALNYAIDRNAIIKKIYFGEAKPTTGPFWPTTLGVDTTLQPYPYDPKKAKQLLAEAGHANGFKTQILSYISSSTPLIPEVSEALVGYFKNIGVEASVASFESGVYFGKWREKTLRGIGAISVPASSYFDGGMMLATQYAKGGPYAYFSNAKLDELAEKQKTEMNAEKREQLLRQADRLLYEEASDLFTISVNTVFGAGPKIKDWKLYAANPYLAGLEYVVPADK